MPPISPAPAPPGSPAPLHPISVTVHFDENGRLTPLKFTWRGHTYTVASTGRRWDDDEGHHLLVMLPTGAVYELLLAPDHRWYLKRVHTTPPVA